MGDSIGLCSPSSSGLTWAVADANQIATQRRSPRQNRTAGLHHRESLFRKRTGFLRHRESIPSQERLRKSSRGAIRSRSLAGCEALYRNRCQSFTRDRNWRRAIRKRWTQSISIDVRSASKNGLRSLAMGHAQRFRLGPVVARSCSLV